MGVPDSPPYVFDADEQDFRETVVERSVDVPVLVDFWAPWCGPCQALGPMLEKLAAEYAGGFLLAKVNTDESPELSAALQIQSIPMVHLFVGGRPIDGFVGALPESEIRAFLDRHVQKGAGGEEGGADAEESGLFMARARFDAGDLDGATAEAEALLDDEEQAAAARLLLARIAFARDDEAGVLQHVEAIDEDAPEAKEAARLRDALAFRRDCGEGEAAWRTRLEADPEDLDARYGLGCCLAAAGRYEEALQTLLEVVKKDRNHQEQAARKAMVAIFGLLGPGNDLVSDYRKTLALYI